MTREDLYNLAITSVDELIQYCNDVLENKIVSCVKHKWSCKRFLRDLERQGSEDFPYIFDEEKANKFLKWMTFFKHTKGPLTGQYKIPEPIEKFIFGNIYGWVHKDTGYRRFRKGYWQVGRKNAKSQDLAIMGLNEMSAFGEPYSEVYVAATKKDQTRYVWGEATLISGACKELKGKILTKYYDPLGTKAIIHPKSGSFFTRMSKDDKEKGDGSNPQCGLLDEYHAHKTSEFYDVLSSGMKTRKQPLLFIITTAGFDLNNPCYKEEYRYVSNILNPDIPIENDRYFVMINELDIDEEGKLLDDIKDPSVWPKANPIVCKTQEGIDSIKDELQVALGKPEKMRDFLTKTMNVWINQRAFGYMNMAKWKACGASKTNPFPDLKGLRTTAGIDLSSTIDLTSVTFETELPDGRIAVTSHSFMPEETFHEKIKDDRANYDFWEKQRWITVTPGAEVDYSVVLDYIVKIYDENEWPKDEVCFDRHMATWLRQELEKRGFVGIEVPQTIAYLSLPTKDFRSKTYAKKIIHNNNPVLTWAIGNAVLRPGSNENIMLDKSKSVERIDPAAAGINAHFRVMLTEEKLNVSEFAEEEVLDKLWG